MMSLMSRQNRCRIFIVGIVILLSFGVPVKICSQGQALELNAMQKLSDEQIINTLSSHDAEKAHQAVEEIVARGERMIPLLIQCKGNVQAFYGYGLGSRLSSFTFPSPTGNKKLDEGSVITVEVAALYLISAIYYQTLEFAQAPYLTDGTPVKSRKFNTPKRVASAWASVEAWAQALKKEGLERLRAERYSPLKDSTVHFWGSD